MKIPKLLKKKEKKEKDETKHQNIPLFFLSFFDTCSNIKILPYRRALYYPAFFIAFYCILVVFAKEIEWVLTFPIVLSKSEQIAGITPPQLWGEHFLIQTKNGTQIHGIFLDNKAKKTVFYFHGNGAPLPYFITDLEFFSDLWYNVMSFDYPWYGKSTWFPYESEVYSSMNEFYQYVKKEKNLKDENIISVGYSVGSAPALEFASKRDTAGVVLIAPFTSRYDLSFAIYGWYVQKAFFLPDSFMNSKKIQSVTEPILFIHGNEDTIIPIRLSKELYRIAPNNASFIEIDNEGHNNILDDYKKVLSVGLSTFIENWKLAEPFYFINKKDEEFFSENSTSTGTWDYIIEKKNIFETTEISSKENNQILLPKTSFKLPEGYVNPFDLDSDSSYTKYINNFITYNSVSYIPDDLVAIESDYIYSNKWWSFLRKEAKEALENMWRDFYNTFGTKIWIASSYRSYEYQKGIKDRWCSDSLCANPGHSEHQAGLAVDVFEATSENEFLKKSDLKNYFWWMKKNAHKYWFHNSYQKGTKVDGYMKEPWHWRYVWVGLATFLHDNNITFAEYYSAVHDMK
jgi:LAS superfamily LD-carboxypeptidase LdcB/pimeloyl-ACP methyl ester carboxylesterase